MGPLPPNSTKLRLEVYPNYETIRELHDDGKGNQTVTAEDIATYLNKKRVMIILMSQMFNLIN